MKIQTLLSAGLLSLFTLSTYAQTNTFPASGNVGIGTTTPAYKLDVIGNFHSSDIRNELNFSMGGGGTFGVDAPGIVNGRFIVNASGNVGIGTNEPVSRLDVAGNITLRNTVNALHAGGKLSFTSFGPDHPGPSIRSDLAYASGPNSQSKLILSSYWGGDKDEITLMNGNVGIGTSTPRERLSVNGKIRAQEIKVETVNWPDYVFKSSYIPISLTDLEAYIKANNHLPEIPSAKEAEEKGISLGEMNAKLLKKIEELTLHLIDQEKRIQELEKKLKFGSHY